eukprot:8756429-Pyramimonas_sp.AAC.2
MTPRSLLVRTCNYVQDLRESITSDTPASLLPLQSTAPGDVRIMTAVVLIGNRLPSPPVTPRRSVSTHDRSKLQPYIG